MTKKILIIEDFPKFFRVAHHKYDQIYARATILEKITDYKGEKIVIPVDLVSAHTFISSDFAACQHAEAMFDKFYASDGKSLLSILEKTTKDAIFSRLALKKKLAEDLAKVIFSFSFIQKVKEHFPQINENSEVHYLNATIPYHAYTILKNANLLDHNVYVPARHRLYLRLYDLLKSSYFFTKILFYPEKLLYKSKYHGAQQIPAKKFDLGIVCEVGREFGCKPADADCLLDDSTFTKNNVIYIVDEPQPNSFNKRIRQQANEYGYKLVNFFDGFPFWLKKTDYLRQYYLMFFKKRFAYLRLCLKSPGFSPLFFRIFRDWCSWRIFYNQFSVKKITSFMNPALSTRGWCAKQNNTESWFLYNSVTHDRLDRKEQNFAESIYYSHMLFDAVVSDKLTNRWLKKNQNHVTRYIDNGVLFSDYVWKTKFFLKKTIRSKIKIPEHAKLLTYFDNTAGHRGALNCADYLTALDCLYRLITENPNYYLAIKCKKGAIQFYEKTLPQIGQKYAFILKHERILDVSAEKLSPYEIMGTTDLAIVAPLSSVIYEAVAGGTKTISFDPTRRHDQSYITTEKIPKFSAHNYDELESLVNYWLNECSDEQFAEFQEQQIKKYVDPYCDHKAMERLRLLLAQ